jgi:hypothetical protein
MAKCDSCGTFIVFGGVRDNGYRYCNATCAQQGHVQQVSEAVPPELLERYIREVHQGDCPKCGGPGPIDVHVSHTVWSALVITSMNSRPEICCRSCGVKSKLGATFTSVALGWWGMPWGLLFTPLQIIRNVGGIVVKPDHSRPSPQLEKMVKLDLASSAIRPGVKG